MPPILRCKERGKGGGRQRDVHRRIDVCIDASMDKCIDVCNVLDGIRHLYHRHLRGPKVLGREWVAYSIFFPFLSIKACYCATMVDLMQQARR